MQEMELMFQQSSISMIEVDGKRGFSGDMIGTALEYKEPGVTIAKLHRRYEDELEQGIDWDWFDIEKAQIVNDANNRYTTRIYWPTGINLITMFSNQPKAKEFRGWAKHVLAFAQEQNAVVSSNDVTIVEALAQVRAGQKWLEDLHRSDRAIHETNSQLFAIVCDLLEMTNKYLCKLDPSMNVEKGRFYARFK